MKKLIVIMMLFLTTIGTVFATENATDNSDDRLNLQPRIEQIEQVYVNMPSQIYFIDSDTIGVCVRIAPAENFLKKHIKYTIKDSTISITLNPRFLDEYYDLQSEKIKIYISSPHHMKITTPKTLMVADNRKRSNSRNHEND